MIVDSFLISRSTFFHDYLNTLFVALCLVEKILSFQIFFSEQKYRCLSWIPFKLKHEMHLASEGQSLKITW